MTLHRRPVCVLLLLTALLAPGITATSNAKDTATKAPAKKPVALIIMDPLSKELACACVRGYAQRDYRKLAVHLGKQLGERVTIAFADDLAGAVAELDPGQEAIVVAKHSVVDHDAAAAGFKYRPLCRLTGMDGSTTLTGFFVAKKDDPVTKIEDIAGRRVFFGSTNADDKYAAALDTMRAAGVPPPQKIETRDGDSDAAIDCIDSRESPPPIGVISSYALPLLEGCGSIKKGDLKVIAQTKPVPFITVFCSANIAGEKQQKILDALLAVSKSARLMKAMETKNGFVPYDAAKPPTPHARADVQSWPDWRGAARDGHVSQLPAQLPAKARVLWQRAAMNGGLAGIAVANGRVIVADRDPADERDVFRCLRAEDGELVWLFDYEARGKLDYGQFPRATPVVHDGKVFLLGAFGNLHCVRLADGKVLWKRHFVKDLGGLLPTWGACATPLIVDDVLIVNPGGPKTSLVALDCNSGKTRWAAPGNPAAYGSFIAATFGGRFQIVGYDRNSLGGWDSQTGQRLWTLTPPTEGDFNVPTPLAVDGKLLVATENNGTRLYGFDAHGKIIPAPLAEYGDLSPDTATPVVTNGRVFGCHLGMHCLDLRDNLKPVWRVQNDAFGDHATIFASNDRVLVVALSGELFLLAADCNKFEVLSRLRLFEENAEVYSHPALVDGRLYVRGPSGICCVDLSGS